MTAILEVRNVAVTFGGLKALDEVAVSVKPSERRAILGPNGAGKTTLFNIISGLIAPDSGRIVLAGEDVTVLSPHERAARGLARTFQITTLFPHLPVLENVHIAVQALHPCSFTIHRLATGFASIREHVRQLLEAWDLWEKRDQEARQLSYGEQRKLEMVMALAHKPKVLLLDEPAAGLSAMEKQRMVANIQSLDKEIAILLIEHHMDVAFALAQEITVLHQGKILAEGTTAQVRRDPRVLQVYLGRHAVVENQVS